MPCSKLLLDWTKMPGWLPMFGTTISTVALLIWEALHDLGHDPKLVFDRAGIDSTQLTDPNARYSVSKMQKLWNEACSITNDPCFGLYVGKRWQPTTFHALGFAWLASSSLLDALERLYRYAHIVSSSLEVKLELRGEAYVLTVGAQNRVTVSAPASIDAALVALVIMCRQICGDGYNPQSVLMRHARLPCCGRFEIFFRAPIEYGVGENGVIFDASTINERLHTGNAELARVNEDVVIKYLSHMNHASISTRVKAYLIERLPSGYTREEEIAEFMNMSLRSLQRKLLEEGTSYFRLLEETRRDLAKDYVENSKLSINEIAYLLGFTAQANFTRAFRRWYDMSPSDYRVSLLKVI